MAQVINTNLASLNAQRNLTNSQNSLNTSLQRLSSGMRINSAKDDAAGLSISQRFTAQIRGLNQGMRNANDGISVAQVAEGALEETTNALQRIRELAIQSANGSNGVQERAALQAEVNQLIQEIDRIADTTRFGSRNLLDGSFGTTNFQVGAQANETIGVTIGDARSAALGVNELKAVGTITGGDTVAGTTNGITAVVAGDAFTITNNAGTSDAITYGAGASAKDIADAINAGAGRLGVTATATNSTTLGGLSDAGTINFELGGTAISAVISNASDLTDLAAAINNVASKTGISASFVDASNKSEITLTAQDGRNIAITQFATDDDQTIDFGTEELGGATSPVVAAVQTGTVTLTSSNGAISTANASNEVFANADINYSSLATVTDIDITSEAGAQQAMAVLDGALESISAQRADLGAVQNRLESTLANLANISENVSSARSRIMDTDFAEETANLTRNQILQQAGMSVLSQANTMPQQVLSLLQ